MTVIPFPADRMVPAEPHDHDDAMRVVQEKLTRMNMLVATYVQPGARPNAHTILMMIAAILEDPELCKAAGIERKPAG